MDFTIEGLTDEQMKALNAEIERRVTSAVQTNTKKDTEEVTKNLSQAYELKMSEAVVAATQNATMSEAQKIEALTAQLKQQQELFARAQRERKTEEKLREAGITNEAAKVLTPLIVAASTDETLDATLNAFVTTQQNAVNAALEKQKQELALNVTPPTTSTNPDVLKQDTNTVMRQIYEANRDNPLEAGAMAIQYLLDNQNS